VLQGVKKIIFLPADDTQISYTTKTREEIADKLDFSGISTYGDDQKF
jgi:hypothetical protein